MQEESKKILDMIENGLKMQDEEEDDPVMKKMRAIKLTDPEKAAEYREMELKRESENKRKKFLMQGIEYLDEIGDDVKVEDAKEENCCDRFMRKFRALITMVLPFGSNLKEVEVSLQCERYTFLAALR